MKFELSRLTAQATLDRIFEKRVGELVADDLDSLDHSAFGVRMFALHNDFSEAVAIIDSNFRE